MSMFERPSEDSQLFSAPEPRKRSWRSWPRIVSAFAAGVACTFLIVTFSRESAPPLEQLAKSTTVEQSKVGESKPPPAPSVPEAATAQSGTPAPQPAQSPVSSEEAQQTTDGSAPAREAPNERAGAPEEPARSRDSGTVTKQTPDAAPKPRAVTRSEPASGRDQGKPSSGTETAANSQESTIERQSSRNEQRAREVREARRAEQAAKARERQARRNAERSDKRRTVRSEGGETRAAFDDESRWVRDDTRGPFRDEDEIRRPTREAPVRATRKRADPADEEDDGEVVVRSQRSRDGRERTVYEEPRRERQLETRTIIHEEPARPRIPFIFDLFNGGPRE